MTLHPVIRWDDFAKDVAAEIERHGGIRATARRFEVLNTAMLQRAQKARQPVSAASYLALCASLGLNAWEYFDLENGEQKADRPSAPQASARGGNATAQDERRDMRRSEHGHGPSVSEVQK